MKTLINYSLTFILCLVAISGYGQEKKGSITDDALPFAVAEQVPAYPGCEQLEGKEMKDCTVRKITDHVNTNFNTSLGKKLNLEGRNRIVVQFKIDENGNITNVRSRSLADEAKVREALQDEANRVVRSLPKMQPGQKDGKDVAIMYSLPIEFAVPEKVQKEGENKK